MSITKGRVTIPTNLDVVPETIELMNRWGADAIRDCDGTEFPEELKEKAISLRMITGAEVDRAQIIQRSLEWLEKYYQKFEETSDMSGLMEEYNQMLVNRGSEVCVLDPCGEYRGKALGINDAGELLVEKEDGTTENVYAGEVSVRGVYGYV